MRSALYRLSYRAAENDRCLATVVRLPSSLQSPRRELNSPPLDYRSSAPPSELRGPPMIFDCRFPSADLGMRLVRARSGQSRMRLIGNRQFSDGPRGSRTHYPSIKSRELILMSFRP